jgi:YD repeat-containing protein
VGRSPKERKGAALVIDAGAYGSGTFDRSPAELTLDALPQGTYTLRARTQDLAGNEGSSATVTLEVVASGSDLTLTDVTPQVHFAQGDGLAQLGTVHREIPLDLDISFGNQAGGEPVLAYNSNRVSPQPILTASLQTDDSVPLPPTLTVQLTWDGNTQSAQTLSTAGFTPGDLLYVAQQVEQPVPSTGRYLWSLEVSLDYETPIIRTVSGAQFVVSADASPWGAGWTLGPVDRLYAILQQGSYPAGVLRVFGWQGSSFYEEVGGGEYQSPPGDDGSLTALPGGGWVSTRADGRGWLFDASGLQTLWVDTDGEAVLTFSYAGGEPTGVVSADGSLATFLYNNGLVQTIQSPGRSYTLAHNGQGDLTVFSNPEGGQHQLSYDGLHRLVQHALGGVVDAFSYYRGLLASLSRGQGPEAGVTQLLPAALHGLGDLCRVKF